MAVKHGYEHQVKGRAVPAPLDLVFFDRYYAGRSVPT
jgi:hypothetical protein